MIRHLTALAGLGTLLVACTPAQPHPGSAHSHHPPVVEAQEGRHDHPHRVTLAFAGDVHFQIQVAALLDDPRGLGPISRALSDADVTMVNLESAITERGSWDPKDLERPEERYWFRAPARALDVLADAGVDVVTMANNHGADLGPIGLQDTLRAARNAPLAVIGVGRGPRTRLRALPGPRARDRPGLPGRRRVSAREHEQHLDGRTSYAGTGCRARTPAACTPPRRTAGQPRRRRGRGLPALGPGHAGLPHREAAHHCPRPGRGRGRCHRRQPRPRAARLGMARGHLHQLRPRELRLVPPTAPGDRGAAVAPGGRRGRLRPMDAGPDRAAGRAASPAPGCERRQAVADWQVRRGCAGLASAPTPRDPAQTEPAPSGRPSSGSHRSFVSG